MDKSEIGPRLSRDAEITYLGEEGCEPLWFKQKGFYLSRVPFHKSQILE